MVAMCFVFVLSVFLVRVSSKEFFNFSNIFRRVFPCLLLFMGSELAFAQSKENSEAVINQAGEKVLEESEKNSPKNSYLPPSLDSLPFASTLTEEDGAKTNKGVDELAIKINSVQLNGVAAMEKSELKACYQNLLGQSVGETELVKLSDCVTQRYIDAGYSLSRAVIPEQDVEGGRLIVKVIEGHVDSVKFEGGDADRFGLTRFGDKITEQKPLTQSHLERYLFLISDFPGVSLEDTGLREIGEMTGVFELTIKIKTWQLWSSGEVNNRGTDAIGPYQTFQNLSFNSLLGLGESIGFSYSSVADSIDELNFGAVSFDVPLNVNGMRLSAFFSGSVSKPNDFTRLINGKNQTLAGGVSIDWNLIRKRDHSFWIGGGVWGRNNKEDSDFGTFVNDRLFGVKFYARMAKNDQWGGENFVKVNLKQGLDIWGASSKGDDRLSRYDGDGEFTKFNMFVARNQIIDENWSLFFTGSLQLSSRPLLSSQEFYFGGSRFGRAYESGVVSGDGGLAASLELRYSKEADVGPLNAVQLYGFADIGTIWDRGNDYIDGAVLSSAGFGARLYFDYGIEADLAAAFPIDEDDYSDAKDAEFFFRLSRSYKLSEIRFDQPLSMLKEAYRE